MHAQIGRARKRSGTYGLGTVFAVNTDGSGFTTLYNIGPSTAAAHPIGGLVLSGNTLYGTTIAGGSGDCGTIFALKTDGTGFTILHNFNRPQGPQGPIASLILSGKTLYGSTPFDVHDLGTLFAINNQGTKNLSSPVVWSPICPAPGIDANGQCVVTNSISGTQQFYRLSQ
jgi:uncharacterized repeat protein (TIGR03803 family)